MEKMMQQQFKMCRRRLLPRRKGSKREVEHFIKESKPALEKKVFHIYRENKLVGRQIDLIILI